MFSAPYGQRILEELPEPTPPTAIEHCQNYEQMVMGVLTIPGRMIRVDIKAGGTGVFDTFRDYILSIERNRAYLSPADIIDLQHLRRKIKTAPFLDDHEYFRIVDSTIAFLGDGALKGMSILPHVVIQLIFEKALCSLSELAKLRTYNRTLRDSLNVEYLMLYSAHLGIGKTCQKIARSLWNRNLLSENTLSSAIRLLFEEKRPKYFFHPKNFINERTDHVSFFSVCLNHLPATTRYVNLILFYKDNMFCHTPGIPNDQFLQRLQNVTRLNCLIVTQPPSFVPTWTNFPLKSFFEASPQLCDFFVKGPSEAIKHMYRQLPASITKCCVKSIDSPLSRDVQNENPQFTGSFVIREKLLGQMVEAILVETRVEKPFEL